MNQPAHRTEGINRTQTMRFHRFTFTGNDPRKGWRIPLDEIKYNEQLDEETGYGYFGARYMDHELMTMRLSVDRIPSGLNCMGHKKHKYHPAEQDTNIRAFKYFNKYIDNYTGWKFGVNPIGGYDNSLPYDDSQNQAVLNNGLLRPAWYNYFFPGEILITGFINWLSLENYEEH